MGVFKYIVSVLYKAVIEILFQADMQRTNLYKKNRKETDQSVYILHTKSITVKKRISYSPYLSVVLFLLTLESLGNIMLSLLSHKQLQTIVYSMHAQSASV